MFNDNKRQSFLIEKGFVFFALRPEIKKKFLQEQKKTEVSINFFFLYILFINKKMNLINEIKNIKIAIQYCFL